MEIYFDQQGTSIAKSRRSPFEAIVGGDLSPESKEVIWYLIFGFPIQETQMPSPIRIGARKGAAIMRGIDGNDAIFSYVPPPIVPIAPRNTVFPNQQSNPAGAIPSYDAGAQIGSISTALGISGAGIYLKHTPGYLFTINVIVAGSAAGAAYDYGGSGPAPSSSNEIASIPNTVGQLILNWPCQNGIFIVPGTGQVLAAKWT